MREKHNFDWDSKSYINGDNGKDSTPNAAFTGEGNGAKKRRVAITSDVNIKGIDQWFNKIETLTDSDGCEDCVDYDFAKRYLRLPIQIDESEDSKNASKGIGGSVFLREYIETKVSLRGKLVDLRFYLIKDLPRNLLLSFDTLEAFDGVMYFRQGKCVLNDLGVELRLKNITSKNQLFQLCALSCLQQCSLPSQPSHLFQISLL